MGRTAGRLALLTLTNTSLEGSLVPLISISIRIGEDDRSPERIRFDINLNG